MLPAKGIAFTKEVACCSLYQKLAAQHGSRSSFLNCSREFGERACGTGAMAPPGAEITTPPWPSGVGPLEDHVYCCPCIRFSNSHRELPLPEPCHDEQPGIGHTPGLFLTAF